MALAILSACSSAQSKYGSDARDKNGMPPQFGHFYSGVVSWTGNWCYFVSPEITKPRAIFIAPLVLVSQVIDLPLTLAADTVAVPFEWPYEAKAPRLTLAQECAFASLDPSEY